MSNLFLFVCYIDHRNLHSFPTRRSSDLEVPEPLRDPLGAGRAGEHGPVAAHGAEPARGAARDRKSTRLNSSHMSISYAVFCLKKKICTHDMRKYAVPLYVDGQKH